MTAGVSERLWGMENIATLVEAADAKPAEKCSPYTKREKVDA